MLPPSARKSRAADTIPAKHLHSSLNKVRHNINVVKWTPDGRRMLTASISGEFTLWNGVSFNFETIMQAHDTAVHAVAWSHSDDWLVSVEDSGVVKYWQPNFNNVKSIQAHEDPIRDLAFAPSDSKFVTASDDFSLKIFDFAAGAEESKFEGHEWDARSVDWHCSKGLLASGSKDHTVKLWDPRTGRCLTTLRNHKTGVSGVRFEPTQGTLLASCARDQMARVLDLRMMRDVFHLKISEKDVSSMVWHPFHSNMISTGSSEGGINHFLLDESNTPPGVVSTLSAYDTASSTNTSAQLIYPAHHITYAHEASVRSLDWHPLGHILTSGSQDRATRFWSRPRPGDDEYMHDRFHIGQAAAEAQGTWKRANERNAREEDDLEAEDEAEGLVDQQMPSRQAFPGLPGISRGSVPVPPTDAASGPNTGHYPAAFAGMPVMPPAANGMPPALPPLPPGMDIEKLKSMFGGQLPPMPPINGQGGVPPPFPAFPGGLPPPGMLPSGFQMPPMPAGGPGMGQGAETTGRRKAPLPSQQESLQEQLRQGNLPRAW